MCETREIEKVVVSLINTVGQNNELLRMSVLDKIDKKTGEINPGIMTLETHGSQGMPRAGGLIDPRMGTSDDNVDCATCGLNKKYCVGHFGHIELIEPVYHEGYITVLKNVLSCICIVCGNLLASESVVREIAKGSKISILKKLKKASENIKNCDPTTGCGCPVPKIKLSTTKNMPKKLYAELITKKEGVIKKITGDFVSSEVLNILKKITNETWRIMGFNPEINRPEYMMIKTFPVPPVQVRPIVRVDSGGLLIKHDDLTHILADILRSNKELEKQRNNEANKLNALTQLQIHTSSFFESKTTKGDKKTKSIIDRIGRKEGRIRSQLMGKRVDFCARTVIDGDPTIKLNELRIPIKIAMTLTFPEIVTEYNILSLTNMLKNGKNKYPGANIYKTLNPETGKHTLYDVDIKTNINLKIGDIVERHLVDGDCVLACRQPSLHKHSMMVHKVKVEKRYDICSFGMSLSATTPYNADFDGDEIAIFLPQSIQTKIESEKLAGVLTQLINPASSTPVMGLVQDGLIGSYTITNNRVKIGWQTLMNFISKTTQAYNDIMIEKREYTGKEAISILIPETINIRKQRDTDSEPLIIKSGKITSGRLSNAVLAAGKELTIQHHIWDIYGADATGEFIDNMQKLVNAFNAYWGATVGIGDGILTNDIYDKINVMCATLDIKVQKLITEMEEFGLMKRSHFEKFLFNEMNTLGSEAAKIARDSLDDENNYKIMSDVGAGSKGKSTDLGQIFALVGLQSVDQNLIAKNSGRTSVYYHKNDDRCESRGLNYRSFMKGITFSQQVFNAMASREGTITQAIVTAKSGYISRKLIKGLEDLMVNYDGTVRTSTGKIIQYYYGGCGIDTTRQYVYEIKYFDMGDNKIRENYCFSNDELNIYNISQKDNDYIFNTIIFLRNILRHMKIKYELEFNVLEGKYHIPLNIKRIVDSLLNKKKNTKDLVSFSHIINSINNFINNDLTPTSVTCKTKTLRYYDEKYCKFSLLAALYDCISPKHCIKNYGLTTNEFNNLINEMKIMYNKSTVNPGEMVGIIAAQSLGEPTTQMTIDTFHASGIADVIMMNPLSIIENLISGIKTTKGKSGKMPRMIIMMNDDFKYSYEKTKVVESNIRSFILNDIIDSLQVYFDPFNDSMTTNITDNDNINLSREKKFNLKSFPWLFRIILNRSKISEYLVSLIEIKYKINEYLKNLESQNIKIKSSISNIVNNITGFIILINNDNDLSPTIHIRFNLKSVSFEILDDIITKLLYPMHLKGIDGISTVYHEDSVSMVSFDENNEKKNTKEQILKTEGSNINSIRYIKGINLSKLQTTDIAEIYKNYGIEAARSAIIKEMRKVLSSKKFIVHQHVSLLVDCMTSDGHIMSIDRHGLTKMDIDILAKITFEESIPRLLTAALYGENFGTDYMRNVSSRIMVGLPMNGGSGCPDILVDLDKIKNSEFIEPDIKPTKFDVSQINSLSSNNLINDVFIPDGI